MIHKLSMSGAGGSVTWILDDETLVLERITSSTGKREPVTACEFDVESSVYATAGWSTTVEHLA